MHLHAPVALNVTSQCSLSRTMTLEPGGIIATGTPASVGMGFTPPKYLRPGDRVAVTIEPIGTLENPVESVTRRKRKVARGRGPATGAAGSAFVSSRRGNKAGLSGVI